MFVDLLHLVDQVTELGLGIRGVGLEEGLGLVANVAPLAAE